MTDHKGRVLTIGGSPAHRRIAGRRGRLARHIVERIVTDIPQYRDLPHGELAADITTIVEENLHAFARVLRERSVPEAGDLGGRILESAARGAEEGMPPAAVLEAHHLAFTETWRELVRDAGPADLPDVLAGTELLLVYLRRVATAVSAAYFAERHRLSGHEEQARYRLMTALLNGEPAAQAELQAAPRYLVLGLAFGLADDPADGPAEDTAIAVRRRLRRMRRELDRFAGEPALSLLDGDGGTVLIPDDGSADVEGLVARLAAVGRVEVTAAAAVAAPAQVPEQVRQTRDILDVVRRFELGPGLYRLADVLVEYQLSRPSAATGELAAALDPLDRHPELLTTLETYLRHGCSRRGTAAHLHVHPNTVDYRLRRAAELTGLDPGRHGDLQKLTASLAARRARAAGPL